MDNKLYLTLLYISKYPEIIRNKSLLESFAFSNWLQMNLFLFILFNRSNEILKSWWYYIELISNWSRNVNRNLLILNSKCTMQKYGTCVSKLFHMWTINIIIIVHFNPDICHASKCASIMQNRFTKDIRSRVSITTSYMNDICIWI